MRALFLPLTCLALPAMADDIALSSSVSAVTLYPQGATVTREVTFSAPAGQHDLILADLPQGTPLASVRVAINGARMGGVTTRSDYVPPRDAPDSAALIDARAEVERLEDALRRAREDIADIELEAEAARARITFLGQIGQGEGTATMTPDQLRDLSNVIGSETLEARKAETTATRRAEAAKRALKDQIKARDAARQALNALVPEDEARAMLAVAITTDTETQGTLTVIYTIPDAGWQPLYDLHLARDSGALRVERGAFVQQSTGENWHDIALTLSTLRPSEQTEPGQIWPWVPRIEDPQEIQPMARGKAESAFMTLAAPMAGAPAADMATASFDGLSVTYSYPAPVSVTTGADRVRLMLAPLQTEAEIVAQAVPMRDPTAFLVARLTNDTGELLLPTAEARFYLDGRYVGQRWLDLIADGAEADISFGPIEGLRLTRLVTDRNEGDRGILSKSNQQTEAVEITVENLTGIAWPLRVIDRVPVSEQEDLEITWTADPMPSERDIDGARGILAWTFDLPASQMRKITLNTSLRWPDGKVLRQ
ncbi:mucoidy inhibitor MuiA family protein [Roseovarius sp.]|uniref:mucoidy inhibitor MuiA family protein n=1 Tax=Roseovarius sp. TaxID=1486281 RepID=UPI003A98165A